ncbi:MAG TPA: hypothetical protein VKV39_05900 [Candidatus Sulfotelmatobacter sp.]|nr:hypothetical protein [Candidatus Sulfotelmatobacter sp.]
MKKSLWILTVVMLFSVLAPSQTTASLNAGKSSSFWNDPYWHEAAPDDRTFFPKDMFWGWAQFDLAPPHNEIDPNLCAGNASQLGGMNDPCTMFARYMLSGILEVRPFGRGPLRRLMVYGQPAFLFGKNIPKTLYTWSPEAIGIEHSWGVGIYVTKGFEFRVTQHFLFDRLGARSGNVGVGDLGTSGPWGRYVTVGVRKSFGTRRW